MELKDKTDLTISKKGHFSLIHGEDVFSLVEHLARGGPVEGSQDVKKGCLPNTRGAHNGCLFTLQEGQVNPFKNLDPFGSISKTLIELLDLNQLLHTMASLIFSLWLCEKISKFIRVRRLMEISFSVARICGN